MPEDFNPEAGASSFDEFLARYLAGEQARQARSIDLSRFLTARTQGILQQAGRFALERGQTELDALHILRVIVEDESVKQAIERIGVAPERLITATEARLPAASDEPPTSTRPRSRRARAARCSTATRSRARPARRTSTPSTSSSRSCWGRMPPPARCWRAPASPPRPSRRACARPSPRALRAPTA